jgi:hypothetical protein
MVVCRKHNGGLGVRAWGVGLLVAAMLTVRPSLAQATYHSSAEEAEREMADFAECIVDNRRELAQQILALPLNSADQGALIAKNLNGENMCVHGSGRGHVELHFRGAISLAGDLAQAFIQRRYARYDLVAEVNGTPAIPPRNGNEGFALCVVQKGPKAAVGLVRSDIGSTVEADAMATLINSLGACTPPGKTITMSRGMVRRFAAFALYRYAVQAEARVVGS